MRLDFHCPKTGKVFAADRYSLVDNQGVVTDELGRKSLKANVTLLSPCPHCREFHRYSVEEIACPVGNGAKAATAK